MFPSTRSTITPMTAPAPQSTTFQTTGSQPSRSTPSKPLSVLFVCMGNICRSPMAEGVFQHFILTHTPSLTPCISRLDSCGTGAWHNGDPPDSRTMATLRAHGIKTYRHAARRLRDEDFAEFDYILGMDSYNLEEIQKRERRARREGKPTGGKLMMFGAFGEKEVNIDDDDVWSEEDIVDPYYGADGGFETVFKQCVRFTEGFIGKVLLPGKVADVDTDADAEEK